MFLFYVLFDYWVVLLFLALGELTTIAVDGGGGGGLDVGNGGGLDDLKDLSLSAVDDGDDVLEVLFLLLPALAALANIWASSSVIMGCDSICIGTIADPLGGGNKPDCIAAVVRELADGNMVRELADDDDNGNMVRELDDDGNMVSAEDGGGGNSLRLDSDGADGPGKEDIAAPDAVGGALGKTGGGGILLTYFLFPVFSSTSGLTSLACVSQSASVNPSLLFKFSQTACACWIGTDVEPLPLLMAQLARPFNMGPFFSLRKVQPLLSQSPLAFGVILHGDVPLYVLILIYCCDIDLLFLDVLN